MKSFRGDDLRRALGARIASRRRTVGLSGHELARRLEISASALHRWEYGVRSPSFEFVEPLAIHLQCSITWLCTGVEDDEAQRVVQRLGGLEVAEAIADALSKRGAK